LRIWEIRTGGRCGVVHKGDRLVNETLKTKPVIGARGGFSLLVCLGILYVIVGASLLMAIRSTGWHITYALDDPYIHLSIARNLVENGTWGINPGHFAGASSSPLWTLLIAGGQKLLGPVDWLPLALNLILVGATAVAIWLLLRRFMADKLAACATLLIALAAPLPMLAAGGMEHVLQIMLVVAFAAVAMKMILPSDSSRNAGTVALAAVCAALIVSTRFEGLFFVAAACLILLFKKRLLPALVVGLAAWAPVALYAAFSMHHGGSWLPNSVLIKGNAPPHSLHALLLYPLHWIRALTAAPLGALLIGDLLLLAALRGDARPHASAARVLLGLFLLTAPLHGQFAMVGWFSRYEAYLIVLGSIAGCAAFAVVWSSARRAALRPAMIAVALFFALAPAARAVVSLRRVPIASGNIYRQQVQMARLAKLHGTPVAVGDIGAVSWFGGNYVVDLGGLADREVFQAHRTGSFNSMVMQQVCDEHGVQMVIIFDDWFTRFGGVPKSWKKVATWTIPRNVASAGATVSIYAVDEAAADLLKRQVAEFSRASLPAEVKVELLSAAD
jgi:hypothetical protein